MTRAYIAQQTVTDYGHVFSDTKLTATLAITTDTSLTVPGTAPRFKAVMKCEPAGQVWVALNEAAAVPAGAAFAASGSELLTENQMLCREVKAGDVIHFFSVTATTDVSVVLYALTTPN